MRCPMCKARSSVVDSEGTPESVLRRRECCECGNRWNTKEMVHNGWVSERKLQPTKQVVRVKERALTKPAPEMDFRMPIDDTIGEDERDVLRELGIDYDWKESD